MQTSERWCTKYVELQAFDSLIAGVYKAQLQLDCCGLQLVLALGQEENRQERDDYKDQSQKGNAEAQGEGEVPPLKALHRHVRHPIPPSPIRLQCRAAFAKVGVLIDGRQHSNVEPHNNRVCCSHTACYITMQCTDSKVL